VACVQKLQTTPTSIPPKGPKPGFGDFATMPLGIFSNSYSGQPELFNITYTAQAAPRREPVTLIGIHTPILSATAISLVGTNPGVCWFVSQVVRNKGLEVTTGQLYN
jgi:hypothetical protein